MDLNDLHEILFPDMSNDEQIEMLRNIRLSRRGAVKKQSTYTKKNIEQQKNSENISPEDAINLLKILTGA